MRTNGFILHRTKGVPYYACLALEMDPNLRHGFSTRSGGVSHLSQGDLNLGYVEWDSPANVDENRRRFLETLGIGFDRLATVAQIHSAKFHIIKTQAHQWNPRTRGDALVTNVPGVAPAVQVADCFPVLISDSQTGAIAAVHAGWRGILSRILWRTLDGMKRRFHLDPARTLIAIGPGIRSCCLEVGTEVASAFETEFSGAHLCAPCHDRPEKYLLELPRALVLQAAAAGIPEANVFDMGACTRCRADAFFSYRAQGSRAGRMMAVICRCR